MARTIKVKKRDFFFFQIFLKLLRVPEKPKISGLRPMERRDVKAIYNLLNSYLMVGKKKTFFFDHL